MSNYNKQFNMIFERLIGHEGEYVYHPNDPGGETKWGITARTARANGYRGSMTQMTREQAKAIYYTAIWQRYQCEQYGPAVAYQFFDMCVNHGSGNAARILQRAVGVIDDGVIGEHTLAALSNYDDIVACTLINAERLYFYTKLTHFDTFGRGWARRVSRNLVLAVEDSDGKVK